MRNSAIDLAAARSHGVTVCGTASYSAPPVELTWALVLGLARNLVAENTALRTGGPWQSTLGADLHGRHLGVVGLGRIGSQVARIGAAFGMEVAAWSPNLTEERAAEHGVRLAPGLDALLSDSDVVTLHLKLGERSRGVIGARELALLKPTAYLVNTSRAALVDHDALLAALRAGRIAGAASTSSPPNPSPPTTRSAPPPPPGHPAPRLRHRAHLRHVLPRGRRGHRRLPGRQPGTPAGLSPVRSVTR
ncbi:NAD(P)-dependent oxidoreductase [Actinomadura keratinilytica]